MPQLTRRNLLRASALAMPALAIDALGCRSAEAVRPRPTPSDTRRVELLIPARTTLEGAGVRLRRSLGGRELSVFDPFLLLDEMHSDRPQDYVKGFPTHPHRGFETVTIMLEGVMQHRDSVGNHGRLVGGSAQWMTAGSGILHSEMPAQERGMFWGLQLWVNLPRAQKLVRPRYQDIEPARIPEISAAGSRVRLIAGALQSELGPVGGIAVEPTLLDVSVPAAGRFEHPLPREHGAFAYVLDGAVRIGSDSTEVTEGQLAALGSGGVFAARSSGGARLLLGAGRRLNEPVARRGPFVMNTEEELDQAFEDYRTGRLTSG